MQKYNEENFDGKMQLAYVENKHILITIPSEDEEETNTVIKVKFYQHSETELLAHFTRKTGNIGQWYKTFKDM